MKVKVLAVAAVAMILPATVALAASNPGAQTLSEPPTATAPAEPMPLSRPRVRETPGTSYSLLRYAENYEYLKDPANRSDWLDSIKFIPLSSDAETYSHFFAGDFIRQTGPGEDIDFFYAAAIYTF
jgi:hypothetical protein